MFRLYVLQLYSSLYVGTCTCVLFQFHPLFAFVTSSIMRSSKSPLLFALSHFILKV